MGHASDLPTPYQDPPGVQEAVAALTLLRHLREEFAVWEPRLIAAGLRQLAAQVSESLPEEGGAVTMALGQDDATGLLGPLAGMRARVQSRRPDLADRIGVVTEQSEQARHAARDT